MTTAAARPGDPLDRWCAALADAFPPGEAEPWDQVGLHVGDPRADRVTGVLVALDVTPATIDEAAGLGADLLVVHHPLLFSPLRRLTPDTAPGLLALRAARAGIAVLAAHTNLDKAAEGTSHPAARVLGLTDLRPLVPHGELDPPRGLGVIGVLPQPRPLRDVARALADGLPSPHLRLAAADPDAVARTVAVVGGAGEGLIDVVLAACDPVVDVLVTADLKHHPTLDALTMGLAMIDAGHFATEDPAMDQVVLALEARRSSHALTAPVHRSRTSTDPWTDWKAER